MLSLALASVRTQSRRYLAPVLAVALGVAFVAAALTLSATMTKSVTGAVAADLTRYAAIVTVPEPGLDEATLAKIKAVPGVGAVETVQSVDATARNRAGEVFVRISTPPRASSPAKLTEGRYPRAADEIAVSVDTRYGAALGDRWPVTPFLAATGRGTATTEPAKPTTLRVVGIVDIDQDADLRGPPRAFATDEAITKLAGTRSYSALYVSAAPGAASGAIVSAITALVPRPPTAAPRWPRVSAMCSCWSRP